MKTITTSELQDILYKHRLWLRHEVGGSCANLSNTDLFGENLSNVDLSGANLFGANLSNANLSDVNLSRADLTNADLSNTNLFRADLSRANLSKANLLGANLYGVNLYDIKPYFLKIDPDSLNRFFPIRCPEYGEFIGWKQCRGEVIVKLQICEYAKCTSAFGRKCRCSAAKVLELQNKDGTPFVGDCVASGRDTEFLYKVEEIVTVPDFDEDRTHECAPGIHFFITRQEAVDYVL